MKGLQKYLVNIIMTIEDKQAFANEYILAGFNFLEKKWAVERGISIIGEAMFKANKIRPNMPISSLQQIIGTRHIVIRDYDSVDPARLLVMIKTDLPLLKTEVETIHNELN